MSNDTPTTPQEPTPSPAGAAAPAAETAKKESWWRKRPSGRKGMIAAATAVGLLVAGTGFGVGYAVGDDGGDGHHGPSFSREDGSRRGPGGDGFDRGGRPEMGDRSGQGQNGEPGQGQQQAPGGEQGQGGQDQRTPGGESDLTPDFDGDGQPDGDSTPRQDTAWF